MRNAFLYIVLFVQACTTYAGVIEHQVYRELPTLGKELYLYGEEHTNPFDDEAMAQREELAESINTLLDAHQEPVSCYLECDTKLKKDLQKTSYFELRDICNRGAYFEQWYVPLARGYSNEVKTGRLCLSSFDIRDEQYAKFEHTLRSLAAGEMTADEVDYDQLHTWAEGVDDTVQDLFDQVQEHYPKKMISYINRDMQRKRKRFMRLIDTKKQTFKKARYNNRALEDFYGYTDLLADFTILNKVANDPRDAIIIHAGAAHTENISHYLNQL